MAASEDSAQKTRGPSRYSMMLVLDRIGDIDYVVVTVNGDFFMSIFGTLLSKIFGSTASSPTTEASAASSNPQAAVPTQEQPSVASQTPQMNDVDVAAVLDGMAAKHSEKLNWKTSIVDLMKLVGMDSSLKSRKDLAHELQFSGDTEDSAAMNIWLHKAVIKKISENGGKVPQELLD